MGTSTASPRRWPGAAARSGCVWMSSYLARRLTTFIPTLLAVALVVFAIFKFVPGDPARLLAGPDATAEDTALIRHEMGLDEPLYVQLGLYVWHTVTIDL